MAALNALLIGRIDRLYAECRASKPGPEAAAACRTAIIVAYWAILLFSAFGDAALALLFGRALLGVWPVWAAVALGCVGALALLWLTRATRAHIEALGASGGS